MPNPEKLAKQGKYEEAAKLLQQRASNTENPFERRRYFDSAARCYELAGEYAASIACFLQAENLQAAINVCTKSKNPKYLSQASTHRVKAREVVRALVVCSLNFLRERNLIVAQKFCEEAIALSSRSPLPEALMNILVGAIEYDQGKIVDGLKIGQAVDSEDFDLMSEIAFIGKNLLSEMPSVQASSVRQVVQEERKVVELLCSNCRAPFPQQKVYSKVIKCEYCGHITKL